jgi:DNA-binding NarL/FixJ family response regulator
VLLIDLSMTEHERPELLHDLTSHFPGTRVLVLAAYAEERCVARVLNQGASGYFVKSASGAQLVEAVRAVAAGEIYTSPGVASVLRRFGRPSTMADASIQYPARSV